MPPPSRDEGYELPETALGKAEICGTGVVTSGLVLGCARLGSTLTPLSRRESLALVEEALALGIRHFDTASIYGQGDSERYLGSVLRSCRHQVCIASKAGQRLSAKQAAIARFKGPIRMLAKYRPGMKNAVAQQRAGGVNYCFEPAYILKSLKESLGRLNTDYLDLFYLHSPDAAELRNPELLGLATRLKAEGLIRGFGISCDDIETAQAAVQFREVDVVQFELDDSAETLAILETAERSGKTALVRGVARRVTELGGGPGALSQALGEAWSRPAVGGIIVGTTSVAHLRENVGAFQQALGHGDRKDGA